MDRVHIQCTALVLAAVVPIPMKDRRHHNNDGRRQIKRGKTRDFVQRLARKLGVPYGKMPLEENTK